MDQGLLVAVAWVRSGAVAVSRVRVVPHPTCTHAVTRTSLPFHCVCLTALFSGYDFAGFGSSTLALRAKLEQKEAEDELEQESVKQTEPEEWQKTTGKKLEKATAEQRQAEEKREKTKPKHREASAEQREAEEMLEKAKAAVDGGEGSDGGGEGGRCLWEGVCWPREWQWRGR